MKVHINCMCMFSLVETDILCTNVHWETDPSPIAKKSGFVLTRWLQAPWTHIGMRSYRLCHWAFDNSQSVWHILWDWRQSIDLSEGKELYLTLAIIFVWFFFVSFDTQNSVHNCVLTTGDNWKILNFNTMISFLQATVNLKIIIRSL